MTWVVEYNDEFEIVILTYYGKTTGEDIRQAAAARIALGKEKGVTKFLIDTTTVETEASATLSVYDLPDKMYPLEKVERTSRIAVVAPESPDAKDMVRFYENTCVNRGWQVRTFRDRESALAWLQ